MTKKEIIKEIVDGISNYKIIPFIGAGLSRPCGALDWEGIVDNLKKQLKTDTKDFLLVGQEFENSFGRASLISNLEELCELKKLDSKALDVHLKILAMNPPVIYTTNYDNAIEEAANLLQRHYKKVVGLKDIVDSKHGENQIIKFHGDFIDSNSIVFTRNDYDSRLNIDRHPLDILFRSHILGKSVLFLGYGFGDENIDYIFKKHTELYGSNNLPKSYIVAFEKNIKKENELKEKNIITLGLSSIKEFIDLINEINVSVFQRSLDSQFNDMFKPMTSIVLADFEISNLENYINSTDYSDKQKHDKIRETLEGKTIPKDIEQRLHLFFETLIQEEYSDDIKEAILISFQHTHFTNSDNILKLCLDFMSFTENPRFVFDMDDWGMDVLMVIERKLSDLKLGSVEIRRLGSIIILGYLQAMIAENKKLVFKQIDRLLDGLKNFGYEELGDLGAGFTAENNAYIINHYLNNHSAVLRARFQQKGIGGKRIPTQSELVGKMMKEIPKNLNK